MGQTGQSQGLRGVNLLDLFCGAGGAAVGYHQAGFDDIIGIVPQPNYPFEFIQADALQPPVDLDGFDLIHASPPCQAYSVMTLNALNHPDYIDQVRIMLETTGRDYIIENVVNAPLLGGARLCGSMFGLEVQRHRYFEATWLVMSPPCNHQWIEGRPWTVTGHLHRTPQVYPHSMKPTREDAKALMEMPWADWREVVEAIPPAYTKFIGEQFLAQVRRLEGVAAD